MKLIAYISIWIALALAFSIAAQADDHLFTVTPISDNKVILNRIVEKSPGQFVVTDLLLIDLVDGPWHPERSRIRFNANDEVSAQLAQMNHTKPWIPESSAKISRAEAIVEEYDFDVKRIDVCGLLVDRSQCLFMEPIYSFSMKYTHHF